MRGAFFGAAERQEESLRKKENRVFFLYGIKNGSPDGAPVFGVSPQLGEIIDLHGALDIGKGLGGGFFRFLRTFFQHIVERREVFGVFGAAFTDRGEFLF